VGRGGTPRHLGGALAGLSCLHNQPPGHLHKGQLLPTSAAHQLHPRTKHYHTMTSSLSSSDTHENNLPFPSSSGHEEHHTSTDLIKPVALRSALKLSSSSTPSGSQNPHSKSAEEPQDGLRSSSSPSLPSSTIGAPASSPLTTTGFPLRPSLSRARSSGELLPPGYERRVGFSTMETEEPTKGGGTGAEYSFTLQAKSSNYKPRRDSRCFLVATDGESYSIQALDWLMSSLVEVSLFLFLGGYSGKFS
jgi:hypothetical protein